jgi:3-mercaptopyruvate sulfurtransferase SseA
MPQMTPAQFKSNPLNDIRVDAEIIKARMDDPSFVVIDARTPMESMQAGVPNSMPHDWMAGVGTNGSLFTSEADL